MAELTPDSTNPPPIYAYDAKELRKLIKPFFWFVAVSVLTAFLIPNEPLTLLGIPEWKVALQDWTPMLLWGGANLASDPELVTVHTFLISWASLGVAVCVLAKPIRLVESFRLRADPNRHAYFVFLALAALFYIGIETSPDIQFSKTLGSAHLRSRAGLAFVHVLYFVHIVFFVELFQYLWVTASDFICRKTGNGENE